MTSVTAVIPAFNESARIGHTLESIREFVDEVIVIDDASDDETASISQKHGARVIRHDTNKGYIEAIKTGFESASGDIVVTFDADGEFDAQDIPRLVKPILDDEADMVQGRRNSVIRPSERIITWFAQRKAVVGDSGTGLRALRTDLARSLRLRGACICGTFSLEVIAKGGRLKEVPVTLRIIEKPRRIAWFHLRQLFYIFPWYIRKPAKSYRTGGISRPAASVSQSKGSGKTP